LYFDILNTFLPRNIFKIFM